MFYQSNSSLSWHFIITYHGQIKIRLSFLVSFQTPSSNMSRPITMWTSHLHTGDANLAYRHRSTKLQMVLQGVSPRQLHVSLTHRRHRFRSPDWPTSISAWQFVASGSKMTVPGRWVLEVLRLHRHLLCQMKPKHLDKREVFNSEFIKNWYFTLNVFISSLICWTKFIFLR